MEDEKLTTHEEREQKRQQKEEMKKAEHEKLKNERLKKKVATYGGASLGIVAVLAAIFFLGSNAGVVAGEYNLSGVPDGFVHWHADVDIVLCGKEIALMEPAIGDLIGTENMHAHDKSANLASLPGSDGNGVLHSEGMVKSQPEEHTLKRFMDHMNIRPFGSTELLQYRNGDLCDGSEGMVKLFVNGQRRHDFDTYIPRNRDFIRLEFS